MKELSIEEKARRYDEAIERAKKINNEHKAQPFDVMTRVFPELRESENLRIIKAIKYCLDHVFTNYTTVFEVTKEQCLSWLKKQGEQKPYASETMNEKGDFDNGFTRMMEKEQKPVWSEEDDEMLDKVIKRLHKYSAEDEEYLDRYYWLKGLKDRCAYHPKRKWSEEEIIMKCEITNVLQKSGHYEKEIAWLKSLRPQNKWKPSDEQMEALEHFIVYHNGSSNYAKDLEELRLQLKKLREE